MLTVADFYRELDTFAPFATAETWDNVGLLVGSPDMPVKRVLFALDVTEDVLAEAKAMCCELIISHHPVIFTPIKSLSAENIVYKLVAAGIAVICAHTNLDLANGGVNDILTDIFELSDVRGLQMQENGCLLGRIGKLKTPITADNLALFVKQRLNAGAVRIIRGQDEISTVAVCGGSGCMLLHDAKKAGAQALITGEAKHNELILARELGITLIDAGHHNTEIVALMPLMKKFAKTFDGCELFVSKAAEPACYL